MSTTGTVIDSVTAQHAPVVNQFVSAASGDAGALQNAAGIMRYCGSGLGETQMQLREDGQQLGQSSGKARRSFDRALSGQLGTLEATSSGALRCADAMQTLAAAMNQAHWRATEISTTFELNAQLLSWAEAIPFLDRGEILRLAQRNGENAVSAGRDAM